MPAGGRWWPRWAQARQQPGASTLPGRRALRASSGCWRAEAPPNPEGRAANERGKPEWDYVIPCDRLQARDRRQFGQPRPGGFAETHFRGLGVGVAVAAGLAPEGCFETFRKKTHTSHSSAFRFTPTPESGPRRALFISLFITVNCWPFPAMQADFLSANDIPSMPTDRPRRPSRPPPTKAGSRVGRTGSQENFSLEMYHLHKY